jgi:hypothetical protein
MKIICLFVLSALSMAAQQPYFDPIQRKLTMTPRTFSGDVTIAGTVLRGGGISLPGTCSVGDQYFLTVGIAGNYQCTATDTWTLPGSTTPTTLTTSGAGPTCDLGSDHSVVLCKQTLTANVTAATFSNLWAGARFIWAWTQGATPYTVAYTGSVSNTCPVATGSGIITLQRLVSLDGSSVIGEGCTTTDAFGNLVAPEGAAITTTTAGEGALTFDSASHTVTYYANNSATRHAIPRVASGDQMASSDLSDSANVAKVDANTFTGTHTFGGATGIIPAKTGASASLPATCTVGQQYFKTDASAGHNRFDCTATDTWTEIAGSGAGTGQSLLGALLNTQVGSGATNYSTLFGGTLNATIGVRELYVGVDGTASLFTVTTSSTQPAGCDLHVYFRAGGSDQIDVSIPGNSVAGSYASGSTATWSAGDKPVIKLVNGACTSANVLGWTFKVAM